MKIRFPVSANATVGIIRSVVLKSYFRKSARHLKGYVGSPHISSITYSQDFRKVHVGVPLTVVAYIQYL